MSNNGWNWRKPPGCPEPPEPDEFDEDYEEPDPEDDPMFWDRLERYEERRKRGG